MCWHQTASQQNEASGTPSVPNEALHAVHCKPTNSAGMLVTLTRKENLKTKSTVNNWTTLSCGEACLFLGTKRYKLVA
jgi:hypothetical protein